MLLLYPGSAVLGVLPQDFTFHYASTISLVQNTPATNIIDLYIPLCFYYIALPHSALLLSNVLYIPLCFYYILFRLSEFTWSSFLYIPLCFYYIAYAPVMRATPTSLHSTMLLLYPVPVFPFYFLQYRYTFCLPPFLVDFFSKIIHLSLYKV